MDNSNASAASSSCSPANVSFAPLKKLPTIQAASPSTVNRVSSALKGVVFCLRDLALESVLLPYDALVVLSTYTNGDIEHFSKKYKWQEGSFERMQARISALCNLAECAADGRFVGDNIAYFQIDSAGHFHINTNCVASLPKTTLSEIQQVLARHNQRVDETYQAWDEMSVEDRCQMGAYTLTSIAAPWLMKRACMKTIQYWNKKHFGNKNKPPLHSALPYKEFEGHLDGTNLLSIAEAELYVQERPLESISYFKENMYNAGASGREKLLYVVDKRGQIFIAPDIQFCDPSFIPTGRHDRIHKLPCGRYGRVNCHAYMVPEGEAISAGHLLIDTAKKKIISFDGDSGHFRPRGTKMESAVRAALKNSGCTYAHEIEFVWKAPYSGLTGDALLHEFNIADARLKNRYPHPGNVTDLRMVQATTIITAENAFQSFSMPALASDATAQSSLPSDACMPFDSPPPMPTSESTPVQVLFNPEASLPPLQLPRNSFDSNLAQQGLLNLQKPIYPKSFPGFDWRCIPNGIALNAGAAIAGITAEGGNFTFTLDIKLIGGAGGIAAGILGGWAAIAIGGLLITGFNIYKALEKEKSDQLKKIGKSVESSVTAVKDIEHIPGALEKIFIDGDYTPENLKKIKKWLGEVSGIVNKKIAIYIEDAKDILKQKLPGDKKKGKKRVGKPRTAVEGGLGILNQIYNAGINLVMNLRSAEKAFPALMVQKSELDKRLLAAKGFTFEELLCRLGLLHQATVKDEFVGKEQQMLAKMALQKITEENLTFTPTTTQEEKHANFITAAAWADRLKQVTPFEADIDAYMLPFVTQINYTEAENAAFLAVNREYSALVAKREYHKAYDLCLAYCASNPTSRADKWRVKAFNTYVDGCFYNNCDFNATIDFVKSALKLHEDGDPSRLPVAKDGLISKVNTLIADKNTFYSQILNTLTQGFFDTVGKHCLKSESPRVKAAFQGLSIAHTALPDLFAHLIMTIDAFPRSEMAELLDSFIKSSIKSLTCIPEGATIIPTVIASLSEMVLRSCQMRSLWYDQQPQGKQELLWDFAKATANVAKPVVLGYATTSAWWYNDKPEEITTHRISMGQFFGGLVMKFGFYALEKRLEAEGRLPESERYYVAKDLAPFFSLAIRPVHSAYKVYQAFRQGYVMLEKGGSSTSTWYGLFSAAIPTVALTFTVAYKYHAGMYTEETYEAKHKQLLHLYKKSRGTTPELIKKIETHAEFNTPVRESDSKSLKAAKIFCFEIKVMHDYDAGRYDNVLQRTALLRNSQPRLCALPQVSIVEIPMSMIYRLNALLQLLQPKKSASSERIMTEFKELIFSNELKPLRELFEDKESAWTKDLKEDFISTFCRGIHCLNHSFQEYAESIAAIERLPWKGRLEYYDPRQIDFNALEKLTPTEDESFNESTQAQLFSWIEEGEALKSKLYPALSHHQLASLYIDTRCLVLKQILKPFILHDHKQKLQREVAAKILNMFGVCLTEASLHNDRPNLHAQGDDLFDCAVAEQVIGHTLSGKCESHFADAGLDGAVSRDASLAGSIKQVAVNYVKEHAQHYQAKLMEDIDEWTERQLQPNAPIDAVMVEALGLALKMNIGIIDLDGQAEDSMQPEDACDIVCGNAAKPCIKAVMHVHDAVADIYLGYRNGRYLSLIPTNQSSLCMLGQIIQDSPACYPPKWYKRYPYVQKALTPIEHCTLF